MLTDPIADMLNRLRNATAARQSQTSFPYSKLKEAIIKILADRRYITSYKVSGVGIDRRIEVELDGSINSLVRVSKPGRRIYAKTDEIPQVLGGRGIVIISTPGGVMTGREARQRKLGGELICKVW